MTELAGAVEWQSPPRERGRLHRPRRAIIAGVEAVVAAAAVWFAFVCWPKGVHTISMTLNDGTVLTSTRYVGSWMAAAIGLGTLAALLLLDAARETLLAVRAPHRSRRKPGKDETLEETYGPGHA